MNNTINNYIVEELKFLMQSNFVHSSENVHLNNGITYTKHTLNNGIITLEFIYRHFTTCHLLDIYIGQLNKNKCFSFEEFLLSKSIKNYQSRKGEDGPQYVSRILAQFRVAIENELKEVLLGNTWIDVPKDYSILR